MFNLKLKNYRISKSNNKKIAFHHYSKIFSVLVFESFLINTRIEKYAKFISKKLESNSVIEFAKLI